MVPGSLDAPSLRAMRFAPLMIMESRNLTLFTRLYTGTVRIMKLTSRMNSRWRARCRR